MVFLSMSFSRMPECFYFWEKWITAFCEEGASSLSSSVFTKSCYFFCGGRCKEKCRGSHFRWLERTYKSPVWDSHWFHCLSLAVFVVQGLQGSSLVFHNKHTIGGGAIHRPVCRVLYQSIWPSARAFFPSPLPSPSSFFSSLHSPLGNVGF